MKLYQKKFLRKTMKKQIRERVETRNAVVYDIDNTNRTCRVKIQGSYELITARFPRDRVQTPGWLKTGNAVTVRHIGGNRSLIEVIGNSLAIPTLMPDDPTGYSGTVSYEDAILTGLLVSTNGTMNVIISSGTFRLGSQIYNCDGDTIAITPASADNYRIDLIVVGADGVLDYVVGGPEWESDEDDIMPAVPANHLLITSVLAIGNNSTIEDNQIGIRWEEPRPTTIEVLTYSTICNPEQPPEGMSYTYWIQEVEAGGNKIDSLIFQIKDQFGTDFIPKTSSNINIEQLGGTLGFSGLTGGSPFTVAVGSSTGQFSFGLSDIIDAPTSGISPSYLMTYDKNGTTNETAAIFFIAVFDSSGEFMG